MPAAITHGEYLNSQEVPVRLNGLVVSALVALGVVIAYDKVKGGAGGLRKGA